MLSPIEDIIEDARNGRMFILVDHEDRENEGDLVIPAQMATPEVINFMAVHGRGLICLALDGKRLDALHLPMMASSNQSRHETAFTVSIEAREGVTTGISAHDRARTIAVAIDETKTSADLASPGHVFPLRAREGGVLVRAGHTEAAVDIARLAGMNPSGVICEIMKDDGTMARLPDLIPFAQKHNLKIGAISDLIAYRRRHDSLVSRVHTQTVQSKDSGAWQLHLFKSIVDDIEHVALVKGDITTPEPVLTRMHAVNILSDILELDSQPEPQLPAAMQAIAKEGRGVIVLIREINGSQTLQDRLTGQEPPKELRNYGTGAEILNVLGLRDLILLTNTPQKRLIALDGYGLRMVDTRSI
jgi:3,4-dihydroxy 2-butanone 4-phosphate synthase / GTP cyclohydrolase II